MELDCPTAHVADGLLTHDNGATDRKSADECRHRDAPPTSGFFSGMKKKGSVGEDSAYVTGPGSAASASSSADDEDDDDCDSVDSYSTANANEGPETTSSITSAPTAADRRREMHKKKSCPAPSSKGVISEDDVLQRLALSDDESGSAGPQQSSIGRPAAGRSPFVASAGLPPYAMISVAGTNRRRLGQKRINAATGGSTTTEVGGGSSSSSVPVESGNAVEKSNGDGGVVTLKRRGSRSDSLPRLLERQPSSLFYLDYINEENDDDGERAEESGFSPSSDRRPSLQFAELSTSRKFSAAAYAPRVVYYIPDEDEANDVDDVQATGIITGQKAAGKVRDGENLKARVTAIQAYEDNLRQVRFQSCTFCHWPINHRFMGHPQFHTSSVVQLKRTFNRTDRQ